MKIELYKVTWYSKLLAVIIFVITFYVGFKLGEQKKDIITIKNDLNTQNSKEIKPISISSKDIREANFTGKISVIKGSSLLALKTQEYVDNTVKDFKNQADQDVPELRKEFGSENPTSNYNLNIETKYLNNPNTESTITTVYTFTGGAHGSSYYKVFTVSKKDNKILAISDLIKNDSQKTFTEIVKKELNNWRPDGSETSPLFPDVVKELTLNDFGEWSLNNESLIIYFSQYSIGPGVLGQTAFPIPVSKIKDLLNQNI